MWDPDLVDEIVAVSTTERRRWPAPGPGGRAVAGTVVGREMWSPPSGSAGGWSERDVATLLVEVLSSGVYPRIA